MPPKKIECNPNCKPEFKPFKNGVSTKMIQAQMIRLNGRRGVPIINSRTESIYKDIYSMDFNKNKQMLITFRYSLYRRYFDAIANCSVGSQFVMKLNQMLSDIISSLTQEEYNIVFGIVIAPPPINIDYNPITDYTFYVIIRQSPTISYFMIKNIRANFILQSGYKYTFDLSDPSNYGTKFALSYDKNGIHVPGLLYVGTPGETNAKLIFSVPKLMVNMQIYIFNDLDRNTINNRILDSAYTIWGYNNPYIVTDVGYYLAITDVSKYLTKCVIQDCVLSIFESSRGPQYFINNNSKEDPDLFFKVNFYQYILTYGTYYMYIPKFFDATILNKGFEQSISLIGDDDKKTTDYLKYISLAENEPPDGSYNFYWDFVKVTVYKPFTGHLSVYSKKFGFMYGFDLLLFSDECDPKTPNTFDYITDLSLNYDYYGLCAQNRVNVIDSTYVTFNDHLTYSSSRKYNMYLGEYMFFIPQSCPITFMNRTKESIVSVDSLNTGSYYTNTGPDGFIYKFYYGVVRVTIRGDFGHMSFCSLKNGYMGGYKIFGYDSNFSNAVSYPDPLSIPTITYLDTITSFSDITYYSPSYTNLLIQTSDLSVTTATLYSLIRESSSDIIYNSITTNGGLNINGITASNTSRFLLATGIYVFRSINNRMAIINNSLETKITYGGGGTVLKSVAQDGNTYSYYKDYLIVHVFSTFGFVSMDILGIVYGQYSLCCF
jgi:hypothetical protein